MAASEELKERLAAALHSTPRELALSAAETPGCLDPQAIARMAAGEVDEAVAQETWQHVAACDRCLLALDAALSDVAEGGTQARDSGGAPRTRKLWLAGFFFAAAAALLLVLFRPDDLQVEPRPTWAASLAVVHPLELRVTRGPADSTLERARAAYVDSRWLSVDSIAREADSKVDELRLLWGSALLLLDRPEEALAVLESSGTVDSAVGREALWACAQAELLVSRPTEAVARLQPLAETPGARYRDAVALLAAIRERLDVSD